VQELSDGDEESLQIASQILQIDQHEADDVSHPASLHLTRSPLFRTDIWQPSGDCLGNSVCSICLQGYELHEMVTTILRCNHRFHLECLRRWMAAPPFSCPMCRLDAADLRAVVGPKDVGALRHGRQPLPRSQLPPSRATPVSSRVVANMHPSAATPRTASSRRSGAALLVGSFGQPAYRISGSVMPNQLGPRVQQGRNSLAPRLLPASESCSTKNRNRQM